MKKILVTVIFIFIFLAAGIAEMIDGSTDMYLKPGGEKIGVLYDGTKVTLKKKQGSWLKVSLECNNHRDMYQELKKGTGEVCYLYDMLLGRIGRMEKGVKPDTVLKNNKVIIQAYIRKDRLKDKIQYYLEGQRNITSPRSVYLAFSKPVKKAEVDKIIKGLKNIDPTNYDRDVLYIEVGYKNNKATTVFCYGFVDGKLQVKERYHLNQNGDPEKYVRGYDPVETRVLTYYNNNTYKEFFWSKSPQTSIYGENGYVNFVVYSEDYEYQIHIPLTVADNAAYVPPFCVTAGTAFIYKDSRISGETVARSEFGDSKLTEETLRNIENDALFKNEISKIPSGIDFKNEFEWLKEELAAYYR